MAEIVVLGAGVLGMTTAVVLRVAGHSVAIFAEKRIGDSGSDKDPWFASAYPAASIIPNSVGSIRLIDLLNRATLYFQNSAQTDL